MKEFIEYVLENDLGIIEENVSLKKLTSLRIGGIGRILFIPYTKDKLIKAYRFILKKNLPFYVLGNGTNLLINDRVFDMIFISLKKINNYKVIWDNCYYVEAGTSAIKIAKHLANLGFTGMEFMSVIPGAVGGLIYMNAGAYKRSMEDIIESVSYLSETGEIEVLTKKDLKADYRYTIFQDKKGIILSAIIKVEKAKELLAPTSRIKSYLSTKKQTQPYEFGNAGSTFRNTDTISAWKVIESLNMRGMMIGGAKVSEKHANFLINFDNATFKDMYQLLLTIKQEALEKLGIALECEWRIVE